MVAIRGLPSGHFSSNNLSRNSGSSGWHRPCRSVTCADGSAPRRVGRAEDRMRHGHSRRSRRVMSRDIADRLLESLRPTRHLLTRTLPNIPIGGPEYRQIDRVVQEIDGLAKVLIGDVPTTTRRATPYPRTTPDVVANRHRKAGGQTERSGLLLRLTCSTERPLVPICR